jgi:hypothetical protein
MTCTFEHPELGHEYHWRMCGNYMAVLCDVCNIKDGQGENINPATRDQCEMSSGGEKCKQIK